MAEGDWWWLPLAAARSRDESTGIHVRSNPSPGCDSNDNPNVDNDMIRRVVVKYTSHCLPATNTCVPRVRIVDSAASSLPVRTRQR